MYISIHSNIIINMLVHKIVNNTHKNIYSSNITKYKAKYKKKILILIIGCSLQCPRPPPLSAGRTPSPELYNMTVLSGARALDHLLHFVTSVFLC